MSLISFQLSAGVNLDPRPEYHRCLVSWSPDAELPTAQSTGNQISSRLLSMRAANSLVMLPPKSTDRTRVEEGSTVDCMLLRY